MDDIKFQPQRFIEAMDATQARAENVAVEVGRSVAWLYKVRRGESEPSGTEAFLLGRLFDVDPSYFYGFGAKRKPFRAVPARA